MATNKLNTQRGIGENLLKKPYNNLREIDHANANGMLVTSTNIKRNQSMIQTTNSSKKMKSIF